MEGIKLLCDFSELSWAFTDSQTIESFLNRLVTMVAAHMQAAVCSIYLYDPATERLVMRATHGLQQSAEGRVSMGTGEGLTGLAHRSGSVVCVQEASRHPRHKHIPGINEELYDAFLAMPIRRGLTKIGVLNLQRQKEQPFSDREISITQVIANQLANIIENALLMSGTDGVQRQGSRKLDSQQPPRLVKGMAASEGVAGGRLSVFLHDRQLSRLRSRFQEGRPATLEDFHRAVETTEQQLKDLQQKVEKQLSDVASLIFNAHLLMLKSSSFVARMEQMIGKGQSVSEAIFSVAQSYIDQFQQTDNLYIREKADDVRDLALRICRNLLPEGSGRRQLEGSIVVADDLLPSDILSLAQEGVKGLVLVSGGATSHVAFLARSLRLPLLIADEPRLLNLEEGIRILVDAETGNLHVNPEPDVLVSFEARQLRRQELEQFQLLKNQSREARTRDGVRIQLLANINLLIDLQCARDFHADGIGLYRSEIPFLVRSTFPSEEEQFVVYRRLVKGMPGRSITIRTLDIGGDKVLSYYHNERENNPFLGMRSIRFSLEHQDIFKQQLRALLRATYDADARIMFPMISSVEEFQQAREIMAGCMDDLEKQGYAYNRELAVGMMIEIPATLPIISELAEEADFFSVGTNDLIQYLLAVDRTNEKVAGLYLPYHPAVIRALKQIVTAGQDAGIPVSICGEMANHRQYLQLMVGLGYRQFSLDPQYLVRAREWLSGISLSQAEELAEAALGESRIAALAELLDRYQPSPAR